MPRTWTTCHMHEGDHAEVSEETDSVTLKAKGNGLDYPSVTLFFDSFARAQMTAAAINGDHAELRRLLDAADFRADERRTYYEMEASDRATARAKMKGGV